MRASLDGCVSSGRGMAQFPDRTAFVGRGVHRRDDRADSHVHVRQSGWTGAGAGKRAASRDGSPSRPRKREPLRLARQLVAESVLLAIAGGLGGLAATYGFIELLTRTVSSSPLFPLAVQLTPSPRVAAFTFLVAHAGGSWTRPPACARHHAHRSRRRAEGALGAALARYRRLGCAISSSSTRSPRQWPWSW